MAKLCELPLRAKVLLLILIVLLALWAHSQAQARVLEAGLRTIASYRVEETDNPFYEVITTAEVWREYGIFGETTGKAEAFVRPRGGGGEPRDMQCQTFVYRLETPVWVLVESGISNSEECQERVRAMFAAQGVR